MYLLPVGDLKMALQDAENDRESLVAEYEIKIHSLEEEVLQIKADVKAKKTKAPLATPMRSAARVHSRQLNDSSPGTPLLIRSSKKKPSTITKRTPRNRAPTLDE